MRRIPEETIQQIAEATDIVELIGGYFPLKRAGATYKARCPFHEEKTPSFTVNPQRQIYKCFGCGAGGGAIRFVMEYEKTDFGSAVRKLAERAGVRIATEELSADDAARMDMRKRLLALHADAAEYFHQQLLRRQSAQIARDYLNKRGITGEIAKGWKIGYAPDSWDALTNELRSRGYSREEILESGLVSQKGGSNDFYDRFRNRVMFPICNGDTGEVIAFSGRVLEADAKAAKYLNSPETKLFVKGNVLFGLHRSKRALIDKHSAIVCEGQLDLITAFEAGVQNVIASQGTAFTDKQARILKRYVDEVVLCFDADAAGDKAVERTLPALLAEGLGVRVAEIPRGEDPDSLIRGRGADAFRGLVDGAREFFAYQLERIASRPEFATPRGRAAAAQKIAAMASLVKDPVMQAAVVNQASIRLEISPDQLTKIVRDQRQPHSPEADEDAVLDTPVAASIPQLDPTLRLLVLVALHDEDACAWMREEDWPTALERETEGTILMKILGSEYHPGAPGTLQPFLTTLTGPEEALISGLLSDRAPNNALVIARDCWNELEKRQIRRRIVAVQARLRAPGLTPEETLELQKEILDRQKRLLDIAPPLSPPL